MSTTPTVRPATTEDAAETLSLLRASITELCIEDHKNDPATLAKWLENKTHANFERWANDPENVMVVAEVAGELAGVGLVRSTAEVHLCYVHPTKLRYGVGSAILWRLEDAARSWGLRELRLSSSFNARPFYEHHGYVRDGAPALAFGVLTAYPYRKRL